MPITMKDVTSSQIAQIGYDPSQQLMAVRFKRGGGVGSLYHYKNVTPDDFKAFETAESLGIHFGTHIKSKPDKYPFERVNEDIA